MGKRGHGEGTIGKTTDGRWCARISLESGRRKAFYGKTRTEARDKMAKALAEQKQGTLITEKSPTVSQFLNAWLTDVVQSTRKPLVYVNYKLLVEKHILPFIGKKTLAKLMPTDLQNLYRRKLDEGLSPAYVNRFHDLLHVALNTAIAWNLVYRNVADMAKPPREPKHETTPLDAEQAKRLLVAASGDRLEALYYMALTTAMREGELLGLKWQDIDLESGVLQVRREMQRLPKVGFVEMEPKSKKSIRSIVLADIAITVLKRHRTRQFEERLQAGSAWEDRDLVFCNSVGKPLERQNILRRNLYPLLEKAGLPKVTFHDLRHSAASLLLSIGVHPKVVQEMLGHSDIGITMNTYSHVFPTLQKEAVNGLNSLLSS